MKSVTTYILALFASVCNYAQNEEKAQLLAQKKANNYVYEANNLIHDEDFVSAEMSYRKAISEKPNTVAATYNLGNAYYQKGNMEEALYRHKQAVETTTSKTEKHKAFHNIGNILMQNKQCKEAVEAYKNALRNNPADNETRYNLGLAKACAEQQNDQDNKDDKKDDKKDQDDNQDKKDENKDDKKEDGDQDKQEGDDQKDDNGKPKDENDNKGEGDQDKKEQNQPKPQRGQLSPQQIKNLLEAMNNQEQKVQEKINAEKQKGVKIKTDKDW